MNLRDYSEGILLQAEEARRDVDEKLIAVFETRMNSLPHTRGIEITGTRFAKLYRDLLREMQRLKLYRATVASGGTESPTAAFDIDLRKEVTPQEERGGQEALEKVRGLCQQISKQLQILLSS